ncbi:MAG TPA: glycine oxidase ThiO [Candidatus Acidoferrales bacterium]|nr:glycine oxidase ThiO [Candidatus Acidoferrales bacterium]
MKKYDVAIVGGGIIGATIALELARDKLTVLVLDRQQPGREASWAAAGMLSPAPDSPRDGPLVPLLRRSLQLYPEFVATIEEESGKQTGHARNGALQIFRGPNGEADRDAEIVEHRHLGLTAEPIGLETAREWEPSIEPSAAAAAWLPNEATIEPRLLMDAVLSAAEHNAVEIRSGCEVNGLLREGERCTGVMARGERITAGNVVLAAGCFSGQILEASGFTAAYALTRPVRGQMLCLRSNDVRLRRVVRSHRTYLVPRQDGRIVAGSTLEEAGFRKQVTPAGLIHILEGALALCPALGNAEVLETWSGLRPGTSDDLPIIGPTEMEGLLIATGHYRNGILLAPVTARLIRNFLTRSHTDFESQAFSPLRFAPQARAAT